MKHGKLIENEPVNIQTRTDNATSLSNNYDCILPVNGEEQTIERKSTSSSFDRKLQEVSQDCEREDQDDYNDDEDDDDDVKVPSEEEEISNRTIDIEIRPENGGKTSADSNSGSISSLNNQFGTCSQVNKTFLK